MELPKLLSKYRGSMLAALAGDCAGAQYEVAWAPVAYSELISTDKKLKAHKGCGKRPLYYTDDTEMAHVLGQSLLKNNGFDAKDVAEGFKSTFLSSPPCRWYGASVGIVFNKLCKEEYLSNPYRAAAEQFGGSGSYGNGSAMRVFPIALFYHKQEDQLIENAALSAKITHAHMEAVNGAIVQASAVEIALSCDKELTWMDFWQKLKEKVVKLESDLVESKRIYSSKLDCIYEFLSRDGLPTVYEVETGVGTGIKATEAVCAAAYAFLCCLAGKQPAEFSSLTKVQQVILYAISLGGDTDTIATMAGAIAGGYYGRESVPDYWLELCEGEAVAENLAIALHETVSKRL